MSRVKSNQSALVSVFLNDLLQSCQYDSNVTFSKNYGLKPSPDLLTIFLLVPNGMSNTAAKDPRNCDQSNAYDSSTIGVTRAVYETPSECPSVQIIMLECIDDGLPEGQGRLCRTPLPSKL